MPDDNQVLFNLAAILLEVYGKGDRDLCINRVVIKRTLFRRRIKRLTIYSSRVALIIGKEGEAIARVRDRLNRRSDYEIEIKLMHCTPLPILSYYENY